MGALTFLVGGVRSGKSRLAVEIGRRHGGDVVVLATAEAVDGEMVSRIARHRAERPDWPTIEAPLEVAAAVSSAPPEALIIVDCLTVWLGNLAHERGSLASPECDARVLADDVVRELVQRSGPSVVISNEVGMGVHPETALGREYRDALGAINQLVAAAATTTLLVVAGRALRLRDPWEVLCTPG